MSKQKVAAITGASRGIGAGLVTAYRKLGYAVVANARSITPSDDPMVLTVAGDIAAPGVGTRVIEEGLGIRVNAVSLGVIRTSMHPVDTHETLAGLHPVARMGEISDVVDAITYLETAGFVTGEIVHVDGGQSAGH
jgi:NAD(P)-dependent dehydrogenase (short-subunit alcohol dehydrogenase family)